MSSSPWPRPRRDSLVFEEYPDEYARRRRNFPEKNAKQNKVLKIIFEEVLDKSSYVYQRTEWNILRRSMQVLVDRINETTDISLIKEKLKQLNMIHGKGLFCRALMHAQFNAVNKTHLYASLISLMRTELPDVTLLLSIRCLEEFKMVVNPMIKKRCMASLKFILQLINHYVIHITMAIELISTLVKYASEDTIQMTIIVLRECGEKINRYEHGNIIVQLILNSALVNPKIPHNIKSLIDMVLFFVQNKKYIASPQDPDFVDSSYGLTLNLNYDPEEYFDYFRFDPEYGNKAKNRNLRREKTFIYLCENDGYLDESYEPLIPLRGRICSLLDSSLEYEQMAFFLMNIKVLPNLENEICNMLLEVCSKQDLYKNEFGEIVQILCQMDPLIIPALEHLFRDIFKSLPKINDSKFKSQNVARWFAYLLCSSTISWEILLHIDPHETDTSRVRFIEEMFVHLDNIDGRNKWTSRIKHPRLIEVLKSLE